MDTLRAIAAVLVVVGHDLHFVNELPREMGGGLVLPLFHAGVGAILLLFTAGFMSVYTGWNRFGSAGQSREYLTKRAARLVPFYWLFTTLWLMIAFFTPQLVSGAYPTVREIVFSYLFIPYVDARGHINPILALGWTMNYIFLFDLITASVIRLQRKWAIVAIIAVTSLLMLLHPLTSPDGPAAYFWTGRFLILFAGGAALSYVYKIYLEPSGTFRLNGWISTAILLVAAWLGSVLLDGPFSHSFTRDFGVLLPIITVMGTVAVLTRETGATFVQRARDILASISYSVYLTHPFALGIIILVWRHLHLYSIFSNWVLFAAGLVGSLVCAFIVHHLLEVRVNRIASRLLLGRRDSDRAAGSSVAG